MSKQTKTTYEQALLNAKKKQQQNAEPSRLAVWMPRILPLIVIVAGLILTASRLLSLESEVLFKSQEFNLWIADDSFYQMFSIYPGGWLAWTASYMTEFFFHPAVGVWMLMGCWALIMGMLALLFKLRGWKVLLTAIVPLMLLACLTQTGYWLYYQKVHGQLWLPTLGVGFSVLAALVVSQLVERAQKLSAVKPWMMAAVKAVAMLAFAWWGYKLMGAWSYLGLALMAVTAKVNCQKVVVGYVAWAALACALVGIVPKLAYQWVFEQTNPSEVYVAGMPCFHYGISDISVYRTAYYMLALSFVPMALVEWLPQSLMQKKAGKWLGALLIVALLGGSCKFVAARWYHDKNFHAEIAMSNAMNRQDWEGTLNTMRECASDTISPTRAMVLMKNLALFRLGRAGDEMFNYPEGSRLQNAEESKQYNWAIRLSMVAGKRLYYNYGKLNYCYRWCMEDAVEFGWHVEELKMMALCCMLKGEDQAARKYFDLLKKTRYHKEWVEHYETFLGQPEKMKEDPELKPICYLKEYGNRLDGDNTLIELYLLRTFSNGNGADPIYQEMTLLSAMLMKDIDLFWPRFMLYASMHSKEEGFHMPRHYQEAAYLYGHLENKVDISTMPFDQSVKDSYEQFMAFNSRPDIAPLSEGEKAVRFKPQFGNTFYYFYFLVRNQKTN